MQRSLRPPMSVLAKDDYAPLQLEQEERARVYYSVDQLIGLAGGFGVHQRTQSLLCAGFSLCVAASAFLPNLLYPRLRLSWPTLTDSQVATLSSIFFIVPLRHEQHMIFHHKFHAISTTEVEDI